MNNSMNNSMNNPLLQLAGNPYVNIDIRILAALAAKELTRTEIAEAVGNTRGYINKKFPVLRRYGWLMDGQQKHRYCLTDTGWIELREHLKKMYYAYEALIEMA